MHSTWYLITQVFLQQLQALAVARGVGWLANPPLPLDGAPQPGGLVLFGMPRGDLYVKGAGHLLEERRMRLVVGAKAFTATGLADADELHFAARNLIKSPAFRQAIVPGLTGVGAIKEVELEPELKDIAVQGSMLMSAYEIDYHQTYPSQA